MVENLGVEPAAQGTPKNIDKVDSIGPLRTRGAESLPLRHTGRKVLIYQRFLKFSVPQPISRPILLIGRKLSFWSRSIGKSSSEFRRCRHGIRITGTAFG
jgi:hypothetical protein